ncbi:MAG: hypothetical protein WC058_15545 [Phycisphaeraceae bacterium]
MPWFRYIGHDRNEERVAGNIEAVDGEAAMDLLEKQGIGVASLIIEPSISELLAAGKQEQQTNPAFMSGWMMIGLGALLQLSAYLIARGGLLTLAVITGLAGTISFTAGIIR